ncbi:MAG: PH domain-containing protein, partial [Chitinophagaceae bacterium]
MTYKASLDILAKVVTAIVTIVFATIIIFQLNDVDGRERIASILTVVFLILIYFVTFFFRPISYSVTRDKLVIHRPLSSITLNRNEIKMVERLDNNRLSGTIRTFGVGGLFGYFGWFANR